MLVTLALSIGFVWLMLAVAYLLVFRRDRRRHGVPDAEMEAEAARAARERAKLRESASEALALTCPRCGGPADPMPLTVDRYACPGCGVRFVGPPHEEPPSSGDPDAD
jgi:hypothetical protein